MEEKRTTTAAQEAEKMKTDQNMADIEGTIAVNAMSPKHRSMIMSARPAPIDNGGLKSSSPNAKKGSFAGSALTLILAFQRTKTEGVEIPMDKVDSQRPDIDRGGWLVDNEVLDVEIPVNKVESQDPVMVRSNWLVDDGVLRPVPTYYPLEKSSRFITGTNASLIASGISDCCRIMSIQADFNHSAGTAALKTPEHVEIYIALWKGTGPKYPECVIVEAQRRWGDAVTYHKYCRFILDAAEGNFDAREFQATEEREKEYSSKFGGEQMLATLQHTKKPAVHGSKFVPSDHDNSLRVLEIAASLLKKDRMDARQLGMESLCLLTDPTRTGLHTALLASRTVLTGSAQDESSDDEFVPDELGVREAVLSLVQFGRLEEDAGYMDEMESDDEEAANRQSEEQEQNNLLHNLALAVLANSLNILKTHGTKLAENSGGGSSAASVANTFLSESKAISSRDLLATLLNSLGSANQKPHDALLSARCLRSLCEASKDARRRAKEMNAKNVVATALGVGRRTHAKLETETKKVLTTLEKVENEQESMSLPTKKSESETNVMHLLPQIDKDEKEYEQHHKE